MKIKNRAIGLLTTMAVVLVVGSGVALAATTIHCPNDTSHGSAFQFSLLQRHIHGRHHGWQRTRRLHAWRGC